MKKGVTSIVHSIATVNSSQNSIARKPSDSYSVLKLHGFGDVVERINRNNIGGVEPDFMLGSEPFRNGLAIVFCASYKRPIILGCMD